jgi:hypothetical protein
MLHHPSRDTVEEAVRVDDLSHQSYDAIGSAPAAHPFSEFLTESPVANLAADMRL